MVNKINFSTDKYTAATTLGSTVIAGSAAYQSFKLLAKVDPKIFKCIPSEKFALTEAEKDIFLKKGQEVIDNSKLKNFGTQIILVDKNTPIPSAKAIKKTIISIKNKSNACYVNSKKCVYINRDFLAPLFHELGHAKNHQDGLNKYLKVLRRNFGNKYITFGLPALAILAPKRQNEGGNLSPKDKIYNALRYIVGSTGLIGYGAMLTEEITASDKGYKFAKKAGLNEKLLKIVKKTHSWGFKSYVRRTCYYSAAIIGAIKLKDFIEKKLKKSVNS